MSRFDQGIPCCDAYPIFFCLGENVYEVIGVQYTALCENEKNEKNQHPNEPRAAGGVSACG